MPTELNTPDAGLLNDVVGAADLAGDRTEAAVAGLDRYLLDALTLVGGDGSPLIEGRSLIYRFASAARAANAPIRAALSSHNRSPVTSAAARNASTVCMFALMPR